MLKIINLLVGLVGLAIAAAVSLTNTTSAFADSGALYLALIALTNVLATGLGTKQPIPAKQHCISISAYLLVIAAVLQSLVVLAPLPLIAGSPAIWLPLLITIAAAVFTAFAQLPKRTVTRKPASRKAAPYTPQGNREAGTVKWFNTSKGFGFISRDNGEDIFVHFRAIRGEGHRILMEGQRVEFSVAMRDKGLQAEDVTSL